MFQAVSGHILEMVRKPENQPSLLLITNKKWHTPFQIRLDWWTLDDLEGRYALLQL